MIEIREAFLREGRLEYVFKLEGHRQMGKVK